MAQLSDGRSTFNTFALLWCERCGKVEQPPARPSMPDFVDDPYLTCTSCGEKITLLQCIVRGAHFQERLGMPHQLVATLDSLPDRHGRWT
jgi:hypothetical protein